MIEIFSAFWIQPVFPTDCFLTHSFCGYLILSHSYVFSGSISLSVIKLRTDRQRDLIRLSMCESVLSYFWTVRAGNLDPHLYNILKSKQVSSIIYFYRLCSNLYRAKVAAFDVSPLTFTYLSLKCGCAYPENNATCFWVLCRTLNSNQSNDSECFVEFPLIHFNILIRPFAIRVWLHKFRWFVRMQTVVYTRQCISELCSSSLNLHHRSVEVPIGGYWTYRNFPIENTSPCITFNKNQNGNFLVEDNSVEKFHPLWSMSI